MSMQCGSRLGLSQGVSGNTGLPAWLGFSFAQPLSPHMDNYLWSSNCMPRTIPTQGTAANIPRTR